MDINLQWKLNNDEELTIYNNASQSWSPSNFFPAVDKLIFKSSVLEDEQQGICTKWNLEMTSGKNYFIQLKLCLVDLNKLAKLNVKYKVIFKTNNYKQTSFEGNKIFDTKQACKLKCPDTFLNLMFAMIKQGRKIFNSIFECNMQIQLVGGINNIFYSIQADYEKLLNDTKYSDFMLVTPTKKFNVHKSILAARSEVFSAMLEHDMKEKKECFAEIKEYDDEVVQEFLRYLYCGKVKHLDKLAKILLDVAEKYLIFDLKVLCLEEICKNINIENAVELLSLVDKHNVEYLRTNLIEFIAQNLKMIGKSNLETIDNLKLSNEILCRIVDINL